MGTSARSVESVPELSTFAYDCDDQTTVVANHEGDDHLWLFLPSATVKLPRLPSASGAKYGDETLMWWSRGAEATIDRGGGDLTTCQEQRRRSIIEDAKLRGADFWAAGNEPGWTLEIAADSMRLVSAYATEHYRFATPTPTVGSAFAGTVWDARASDHTLTVTLTADPCTDSMSGESFDGTVVLHLDETELRGCGTALH
jgi:uncharacterized membrane protein